MNKADVIAKVAEKTGVAPDTCEKVIDALEKVLQSELSTKDGMGILDKVSGILQFFGSSKKD